MSGTRALFASIGASVLLVAAAALSLLAVSALFAFGGWAAPNAQSEPQTALILADGSAGSVAANAKPLVLAARDRPRSTGVARPSAPAQRGSRSGDAILQSDTRPPPKASYSPPSASAPDPQTAPSAPAATKITPGDGVRSAGEGLGSTVESTRDALTQVTDPLLPPVSAATQKVLDGVAELLRRSTDGVGGTVDVLLAPG